MAFAASASLQRRLLAKLFNRMDGEQRFVPLEARQLNDEDLTHVLQEALGRRPWLTTPVKQAMREHSATRSSTVRQQ